MTTLTARKLPFALACSLLCCASTSIAAQQESAEQSTPQPDSRKPVANVFHAVTMQPLLSAEASSSDGDGNAIRFFADGSAPIEAMRRRLQDPAQRAQLRAEQDQQIREQHSDIAEALDLDPTTAEKLLQVIADQRFEGFEHFYTSFGGARMGNGRSIEETLQADADAETRRLDRLRAVLGDERLDRYASYDATLTGRGLVKEFDAGLPGAGKLRPEQRERLILLVQEQFAWEMQQALGTASLRGTMLTLPTREEMQRRAQLDTIESNQAHWRARRQSEDIFGKRASQFLTAPQLAAFRQMNAKRTHQLRDWILQARAEAGLDANIPENPPEQSEPNEPVARTPIAGDVMVEITMKVNGGEPMKVSHVVPNGQAAEFEIGEGLSVEATTTLFDDRWLELRMNYFEQSASGKRRIGQGGGGTANQYRPDSVNSAMEMTVVKGSRKGYAITGTVNVKQL